MSGHATIEHYANHIMDEITKRDVEQVSERLRELGWEEVVRCRDCKHFKAETKKHPALCRLWLPRNLSMQYGIKPDGFCAWGERRGE